MKMMTETRNENKKIESKIRSNKHFCDVRDGNYTSRCWYLLCKLNNKSAALARSQDKQISSVDTLIIWFTSFKIIIINYMSLCAIFTAFAIMFITMVFSWKIDDRLIMHECLRIQLIDLFKRWRLYLRRETVFERGFIITLDHFLWKSLKKTSFSTPIMFAV